MAKELPYFRFTSQEWQNGDISLESYELKGLFIDICAYYWVKDCSLTKAMLEKRFRDASELLNQLFELGIIDLDKNKEYVQINFLDEQFDVLSEARKRRQNAGKKGGKQRASNAKAKPKQCLSYNDKDKDNDNDKDKEVKKEKTKKFIKPKIDEIKAYCQERNNNVDPEKFFNYYESKGWFIGKNKMKNWKAAIRTWEKNNFEKNKNSNQNYLQHDTDF